LRVGDTEVDHDFGVVAVGQRMYEVRAAGRRRDDGRWEGWLEYIDVSDGRMLSTPVETIQPDRKALRYWATGLQPVYLEGALARAVVVGLRVPASWRDALR
jgi:hypothetical protein